MDGAGTGLSESTDSLELAIDILEIGNLVGRSGVGDGQQSGVQLGNLLEVLDGNFVVGLGNLLGIARENDETALVLLEALNVGPEGFVRAVASSLVYGDADAGSLLRVDLSSQKLRQSETTAESLTTVVTDGGRMDNRAEGTINGAGEDLNGLLLTGFSSTKLASGLVEPGTNVQHPVALTEVTVGDNVVSTRHPIEMRIICFSN